MDQGHEMAFQAPCTATVSVAACVRLAAWHRPIEWKFLNSPPTGTGHTMTLKSARETFESAQEAANANGDAATALLAAGLAELAKALAAELRDIKRDIDTVEAKVRSLR